jgi:BMFP domain-containing protein YqiC
LRTREQLEALQRTVTELEAQLGATGAAKPQAPQQG